MEPVWPGNLYNIRLLVVSQTYTNLSAEPAAILLPSGDQAHRNRFCEHKQINKHVNLSCVEFLTNMNELEWFSGFMVCRFLGLYGWAVMTSVQNHMWHIMCIVGFGVSSQLSNYGPVHAMHRYERFSSSPTC